MLLLLGLAGCWLRPPTPVPVDPLVAPLAEADALWARRGEPGGLDAALRAYEALLAVAPERPVVHERLARASFEQSRHAVDPAAAQAALEVARVRATACLDTFPSFHAALQPLTAEVRTATLRELPPAAAPCLAWYGVSALRLVELRGPGAALGVEAARPFVEQAWALEPDGAGGLVAWGAAMLVVLDADPTHADSRAAALPTARLRLEAAAAAHPEEPLLREALHTWFPTATRPAEPSAEDGG